ncbi:MAG: hypothetical protein ACXQTQ_00365 [Candidatus Hecatellaceae archaeon]
MRSPKIFYAGMVLLLACSAFSIILAFQMHFTLAGSWEYAATPEGYREILFLSSINFSLIPLAGLLIHQPFLNWLLTRPWPTVEFKRIVATMLLAGGTVYTETSSHKYAVRYYGKDLVLHKIFVHLLDKIYGIKAKPARWKTGNSYITQVYRRKLVEDLLTLSPTYVCRNKNGNGGPQPSAAFLLDASPEVLREALRLAISSTGSIGYTVEAGRNGGRFMVRPFFTFGHLSPLSLLSSYQQALAKVKLKTSIVFDRRFEGRGFLRSRSWEALKSLAEMGGFIPETKVSFGNYRGMERNLLLQALLDFHQHNGKSFASIQEALKAVERSLNGSFQKLSSREACGQS